jgi:hypothetical protein
METDDLIARLSDNLAPARPHAVLRVLGTGLLLGLVAASVLLQLTLRFRHNLASEFFMPAFWVKLAYTSALALLGLWIVERQSRPGTDASKLFWLLIAPPLALALLALWQMSAPDADARALMMGHTARVCSTLILILSLPIFAGVFWAMRRLAPTRLTLAGASAGMLAGAAGAALYCFHCPELSAPFILVWYSLGILLPTALGAALGRWLLRW